MNKENHKSLYTVSMHYDKRLYKQDIAGSIAHTEMLAKQRIITDDEASLIIEGLNNIRKEIEDDLFYWDPNLEDIHMNIESRLFSKIGEVAGKMHTGRSRNDQVATDIRLYCKDIISQTIQVIRSLQYSLLAAADKNKLTVIPGYTHMQRAQPVTLAHHLMAYFHMFQRDKDRFYNALQNADSLPLGSGALAGVPYEIDRQFVADKLGFSRLTPNSMDAVSDRDFLLDYHSAASITMMHISRFAEEIILWSSQEFNFIDLDDTYTTGSSIMPQKRNPDFAEIARGKTGRVYGNLTSILTIMKGLPLTYNRDLQEDKEGLFDTVDTLIPTLTIFAGMIDTWKVNSNHTADAATDGYILATDIADYLVRKGETFRNSHGIVAKLVRKAISEDKKLNQISIEEYRKLSPLFEEDILGIDFHYSISSRNVYGGTSEDMVAKAIAEANEIMETDVVR